MALEQRGARRYYYTKQRIGKRVISQYHGPEDVARALAMRHETARAARGEDERTYSAWHELALQVSHLERRANGYITDVLTSAGFHNHKGEWRRRRG
jgi:hypothetical protein